MGPGCCMKCNLPSNVYLVKLAKFCITLAISVNALDVFSSGYSARFSKLVTNLSFYFLWAWSFHPSLSFSFQFLVSWSMQIEAQVHENSRGFRSHNITKLTCLFSTNRLSKTSLIKDTEWNSQPLYCTNQRTCLCTNLERDEIGLAIKLLGTEIAKRLNHWWEKNVILLVYTHMFL